MGMSDVDTDQTGLPEVDDRAPDDVPGRCLLRLYCGGLCERPRGHTGPCMCGGDDWLMPGSCPI